MDRLFQRAIIWAYMAWREAKDRGSWFALLLVIFMASSVTGCSTGKPYWIEQLEAAQRRGDAVNQDHVPPLPKVVLQPGERWEIDPEGMSRGAWPGSYRINR